jgi:hypothetical protein
MSQNGLVVLLFLLDWKCGTRSIIEINIPNFWYKITRKNAIPFLFILTLNRTKRDQKKPFIVVPL